MAAEVKQQLEREYEAYKKLQTDLNKVISSRTQLVSQVTENEGVLQELNLLDDEANVFKLIGPALVKQDLVEAKSNVSKRIEYIKGELDRVETQIKGLEAKSKEKEGDLFKLQKKFQALAQSA